VAAPTDVTQPETSARLVRWFFGLLFLPYLLAFPYVRSLNNPNELAVVALVEDGTYRILQRRSYRFSLS
jgi:hypothetical protein